MKKQDTSIRTLGDLKKSAYQSKKVKDELRDNLIAKMQAGEAMFEGIVGYENTVIPEIQRAILARHNMNFLGLRGQAKTRMARGLVGLLDEYIPVVEGSEINDDPLNPLSRYAIDLIEKHGDKTPISWLHRSKRYVEKLATPDVSVADLIGDVDPIKAANMGLNYADERVIHFGLIPRANRGLFVINELPDLQARIQVALFNMLQEGDIQIRGFQLRLDLDVEFVFTANPEDYTNRGSIITPLKDRIQSQILTHYPKDIEISKKITLQEAQILPQQNEKVQQSDLVSELLELIAFEARSSELIDQKSGVSARLTITAFEHLVAAAERRSILNGGELTSTRIGDLAAIVPAVTGKVELVYEGEQEGAAGVAFGLIGKAIRTKFPQIFPNPETIKRRKLEDPFLESKSWFTENELYLGAEMSEKEYHDALHSVPGLRDVVGKYAPNLNAGDELLMMEFVLHALGEFNLINKDIADEGHSFSDLFNQLFSDEDYEE